MADRNRFRIERVLGGPCRGRGYFTLIDDLGCCYRLPTLDAAKARAERILEQIAILKAQDAKRQAAR